MTTNLLTLCVFSASFLVSQSLIVPDELPTILSVIYSNIPVIKKGTDSRIGWGFRLGNRADFQVLVELGPQKYTRPLGNQPDDGGGANKREAAEDIASALYAQRQREKQLKREEERIRREQKRRDEKEKSISDTDGGKWIDSWSKGVREAETPIRELPEGATAVRAVPEGATPGLAVGEIDAKSVIPDDAVVALMKLLRSTRNEHGRQEVEETEAVNGADS